MEQPSKGFKHEGLITKVERVAGGVGEGGVVEVEVGAIAACEGCRAKESCGKSKADNKRVIRVECDDAWRYEVGERVGVSISYGVGFMAVALMYIAPLVLLLVAMVALVAIGVDEAIAALLSFAVVGGYYLLLMRNREKFEKRVELKLTKL